MKESVSVDNDGQGNYSVKVSTDSFEFNVWIPHADVAKFAEVPRRRWEDGAIAIGTSAGATVFWCSAPEEGISVLIGHDDQAWDVGLTVSTSCLQKIMLELQEIAMREHGT